MSEPSEPAKQRRKLLPAALLVIALGALLVGPVLLHVSQKAHNVPGFRIDQAFPRDGSFVSGEIFATTLERLIRHELDGLAGWRPNDLFIWGPTLFADNNANRQLGIIQALRESARVLRDNLTKVSATEYDQNLVEADTQLRNDEFKFWFPSAESRFEDGAASLERYVDGLRTVPLTSKPINRRNVELIRLLQTWTDLLGSAHANLYVEDVPFFSTDDRFYRSQGLAHVLSHLVRAVRREYEAELVDRSTVIELLEQVQASLDAAATLKPLVILDGRAAGLLANHRRNLDGYIVDARQLMYSIREELEK